MRWGFASVVYVVAAASTVAAQPALVDVGAEPAAATGAPSDQAIGYGAMPGGIHVPSAETLPKGVVQVESLDGIGYRSGLLGSGTRFVRASSQLSAAYAPIDQLTVGLSLDGRYDKHHDPSLMPTSDDGYVGDPHLLARVATAFGKIHVGGQLGLWLPGKSAPSLVGSATTVDIRGLISLPAGPGLLSFEGGIQIDNSIKSATDAAKLSLQDRVSLGVSDYNEVVVGAHLSIPVDKAWIGLEASLAAFIGGVKTSGDADLAEGKLLYRGAAVAGFHLNDSWSALAFVEIAKVPGILRAQIAAANIPLIPYEPIVTGGVGLQARFGGPKRVAATFVEKDCHRHTPPDCLAVKVPILADITGTVVDEANKPIVGARVAITLKNSQVPPVATDDKGGYIFKGIPIGNSIDNKPTIEETGVEVDVELDGKKPGKAVVATVVQGGNTVPPIKLDPVLPPGQLRGVVRALPAGKAVVGAVVTVSPGDKKVETGADGTFTLDLAPGQYKITVKATGLAPQDLDVTIDPNGVAIKNIDLHK